MTTAGKYRAQQFRVAYYKMQKAAGEPLHHEESDYFTDADGGKVGVTWSAEHKPGKWFLNLLEGKFDEAVLLCQIRSDASVVVRLPRAFVNRYWHAFSRDKKGEVKFNVERNRGIWNARLAVPIGLVEISGFVGAEALVVPETKLEYT